jgi:hypothetical protein
MPNVVVGIDGTNSSAYSNRWVERFLNAVDANDRDKLYLQGPSELGGATGRDCEDLYHEALRFVYSRLIAAGVNPNRSQVIRNLTLTLVGHSRGGHTLIALARDLPIKVQNLFLYDAVDMSWVLGDTSVIRNVDKAYHAMRSSHMRSRESWGNTGTSISGGELGVAYFDTNHGGMGGDAGDTSPVPVIGDQSCTYRPPQPRVVGTSRHIVLLPPPPPTALGESFTRIHELCVSQSASVHYWMRQKATLNGIRFLS